MKIQDKSQDQDLKQTHKKILIVDDEQSIREFFQILLKRMSSEIDEYSFDMVSAPDGKAALDLINKISFDMIISDLKMPNLSGLELLEKAKLIQPDVIFLLITAFDTSETAVKAMKKGAYDYIPKPFNVDEIKLTITSALNLKKLEIENQRLKREVEHQQTNNLVGQSATMQKIFNDIQQISGSTANVLITGESGTGKEVIARLVHSNSILKDKSFVAVNCGAIPDTLVESEMFGHKKGSFTGAVSDKKGFFELADGGSLFLDEIGELSLTVQPKLLRALQEKIIRSVGDMKDKRVSVRFIVATNRDLEKMVQTNQFREDLFYRLNVVRIHIPPLRDRKEDISLLVEHFLEKYSKKLNCPLKRMSHEAMQVFQEYNYPGNVRELENLVERVIILSDATEITKQDVKPFIGEQNSLDKKRKDSSLSGMELPEGGMDMEEVIGELEKKLLLQALKRTNGLKKSAAELLKLSARAFRYRLKKYNLNEYLDVEIEDE